VVVVVVEMQAIAEDVVGMHASSHSVYALVL